MLFIGDIVKKIILIILLLIIPYHAIAIETSATSAILMDMDSKRILYAKNIHEQRSVASISKIMTAVLAIESGKLDNIVTIGDEIDQSYGSGIYIQKGEQMSLRDLVYGLMLRSGNDASYAIAKYVAGDNFVNLMNQKAKEIGMKNTIFNNPNGLDEQNGNYSTVYDMALLTSYAMKLEEYRKIVATKIYRVETNKNTYIWNNKNKLLFMYDYTTGGKTGFTQKAKRTLVGTASKDNLNLVAVTLNDGNDFSDQIDLFEYGFNNYQNIQIFNKGYLNIYDDLYYGNYYLKVTEKYSYPISSDETVNIKFKLDDNPHEGIVGTCDILVNNELVKSLDIHAIKIKTHAFSLMEWFKKIW